LGKKLGEETLKFFEKNKKKTKRKQEKKIFEALIGKKD
jgi:hypothetical protein